MMDWFDRMYGKKHNYTARSIYLENCGFILIIIDILFIVVVVASWFGTTIKFVFCIININTSIDKLLFVIIDKNINI